MTLPLDHYVSAPMSSGGPRHAVTGAYGYSGRYIAQRLLDQGQTVITLTNSPGRPHPFGHRVPAHPLCFHEPARLKESLRGVGVLYNTYWVRFNHRQFTHADAARNTIVLFQAARAAGVRRIVHVSITNPSEDSPLEYFSEKARLERVLRETGISHAILRPAVLFGPEDILINNLAWALRRFPWFAVFGDGTYRLQPIHVEDLAALAVAEAASAEDRTIDAIGPETFRYRNLVSAVGNAIGCRRPQVSVPPGLGYLMSRIIGWWVRDTFLTREEIQGLMAGLLCLDSAPTGRVRLSDWVRDNAAQLGRSYTSELARRRDRGLAYDADRMG